MTNDYDSNHFKATVVGSGVMGAAIAAHLANAGVPTRLLDIVLEQDQDRNALAKRALEGLAKRSPAPLFTKDTASLITPGNIEDDLAEAVAESDWIIEAVLERTDVKRALFEQIERHMGEHSFVSSNTSTIPLQDLTEGRSERFKKQFGVTHFFNPPRYMRLLELVATSETDPEAIGKIADFCDKRLGKEIVACKSTPGFIANRIGCFWLAVGVVQAKALNVSPEAADAVLSRPFGIPKTGVFGLCDLIGLDLIPLIADSFRNTLPQNDRFFEIWGEGPPYLLNMIQDGYTGRKGKGGFFRMLKGEDGSKTMQTLDMSSGEYVALSRPKLACLEAGKTSLSALMEYDEPAAQLARVTMIETLRYAAALQAEISESPYDIDRAMITGYNWTYGPFELIDRIGVRNVMRYIQDMGLTVPPLLEHANAQGSCYTEQNGARSCVRADGTGAIIRVPVERQGVAARTHGATPVLQTKSAALHDIGDGVACLEFRSKMNSVDPHILEALEKSVEKVASEFKGLIVANDTEQFCVGANLAVLLFAANTAAWQDIDDIIKRGQSAYMALKYAPFPVVAAVSGMALGGGCELILHCDKAVAHAECYTGLVEVGVGVVPGWGGCKEMIWRRCAPKAGAGNASQNTPGMLGSMFAAATSAGRALNVMPAIKDVFETIATAKTSRSAPEAKALGYLREDDLIVMNRARLVAEAKAACLHMAETYTPPPADLTVSLPGKSGAVALNMGVQSFVKLEKATEYDAFVAKHLATVLTGGSASPSDKLSEQDLLTLEREAFSELIRQPKTLDRIEHMLTKGKALRN